MKNNILWVEAITYNIINPNIQKYDFYKFYGKEVGKDFESKIRNRGVENINVDTIAQEL